MKTAKCILKIPKGRLAIAEVRRTKDQRQRDVVLGVSGQHGTLREQAIDTALEVAGVTEGWASVVGREPMRQRVSVTRTELTSLGLRVNLTLRSILEAAREAHDSGAAEFGLEEDSIERLEEQLAELETMETSQSARQERKTITRKLGETVEELARFLRDVLDPLMKRFHVRNADFYQDYRNARRIGRSPGKRRATTTPDTEPVITSTPESRTVEPVASTDEGEVAELTPAGLRAEMSAEGYLVEDDEADAALEEAVGPEGDTRTTAAAEKGDGAGLAS